MRSQEKTTCLLFIAAAAHRLAVAARCSTRDRNKASERRALDADHELIERDVRGQ